jgi:hypothetical protein
MKHVNERYHGQEQHYSQRNIATVYGTETSEYLRRLLPVTESSLDLPVAGLSLDLEQENVEAVAGMERRKSESTACMIQSSSRTDTP